MRKDLLWSRGSDVVECPLKYQRLVTAMESGVRRLTSTWDENDHREEQ